VPTTRIEIENVNDSWHAEVEVAGITAFRHAVNATSLAGCLREVATVYRDRAPARDEERRILDHIIAGPSAAHDVPQAASDAPAPAAVVPRKKPGPKPKARPAGDIAA